VKVKKWNVLAARIAEFAKDCVPDVPRGALDLRELELVALFGNDGFAQDSRVQREVELIRLGLPSIELDVRGFGLSRGDGASWAMILEETDNPEATFRAHRLVWYSWARSASKDGGGVARRPRKKALAAWQAIASARYRPTWAARINEELLSLVEAVKFEPLDFARNYASSRRREEAAKRVATSTILSIHPVHGAVQESNPG
jgi:hypothetical protein